LFGIFTVATWFQKVAVAPAPADINSPCESIDDLVDQDPKLSVTKKAIAWRSQRWGDVRVGAYVAALCDPPSAVRRLYEQVVRWFADQSPLVTAKRLSSSYQKSA